MTPPLLQVDDLCFDYPQRSLFDRWSAHLGPGLHGVRGGDGRGKTTLLRLLAGELPARQGQLIAAGCALAQSPAHYRQQVFWIDPRTEAWDRHSAWECFRALAIAYPHFDMNALPGLITALSLEEHQHKALYMLSTGSKRKVWQCAALASGAPVVLLDMPYAALDRASMRALDGLLQAQAAEGRRALLLADYEVPDHLALGQVLDLGD